jgi:hypothetical protein
VWYCKPLANPVCLPLSLDQGEHAQGWHRACRRLGYRGLVSSKLTGTLVRLLLPVRSVVVT